MQISVAFALPIRRRCRRICSGGSHFKQICRTVLPGRRSRPTETGREMNVAITPVPSFRLSAVSLDGSLGSQADPELKREQAVAIFDLLNSNSFTPIGHDGGPYRLYLQLMDRRLVVSVSTESGAHVLCHHLSLTSFRRLFKDYRLVCASYADAEARLTPEKLEAVDMGRRAIHDEASALLMDRLKSKVGIDLDTARRLFTLIFLLVSRNTLEGGR